MVEPYECLVIPLQFPDARLTDRAARTAHPQQFQARLALTLGLQED